MIGAIIQLVIVLVIAGALYWALTKLWPLGAPATGTRIGQAVFILLVILLVFAVIFYGVIPLLEAVPGAFGGGAPFRLR
jgi:hypothetical protein